MVGSVLSVECPNCGTPGEEGQACAQTPRCIEVGYHCISIDPKGGRLDSPHLGLFFGDYLVCGLLGKGGIGAVYEARHRTAAAKRQLPPARVGRNARRRPVSKRRIRSSQSCKAPT